MPNMAIGSVWGTNGGCSRCGSWVLPQQREVAPQRPGSTGGSTVGPGACPGQGAPCLVECQPPRPGVRGTLCLGLLPFQERRPRHQGRSLPCQQQVLGLTHHSYFPHRDVELGFSYPPNPAAQFPWLTKRPLRFLFLKIRCRRCLGISFSFGSAPLLPAPLLGIHGSKDAGLRGDRPPQSPSYAYLGLRTCW